jgi:prophage regulatory protein
MEQLKHALAIIRLKQLEKKIGLKRSSIYEKSNPRSHRYDPTFPVMVSLGERSVGWYSHEVDEWLLQLQKKRVQS